MGGATIYHVFVAESFLPWGKGGAFKGHGVIWDLGFEIRILTILPIRFYIKERPPAFRVASRGTGSQKGDINSLANGVETHYQRVICDYKDSEMLGNGEFIICTNELLRRSS